MSKTNKTVQVVQLQVTAADFFILGTTPLMQNQLSLKAMQDLLYPPLKTNKRDRQINLKHNPIEEFRDAIHESGSPESPTYAVLPPRAFIRAIAQAAADMPSTATKAGTKRFVSIKETEVALFGIPQLCMRNVKLAGRTAVPDIRTRAVFPIWACTITLRFDPNLIAQSVLTSLVAAAGIIVGIGDDRPEHGGSFGQFEVVDLNNEDYLKIIEHGGRAAQKQALENPACYDRLTDQMYAWFNAEVIRREQAGQKARERRVA